MDAFDQIPSFPLAKRIDNIELIQTELVIFVDSKFTIDQLQ